MVLPFWNGCIFMGNGPHHVTQGRICSQGFVLCLFPQVIAARFARCVGVRHCNGFGDYCMWWRSLSMSMVGILLISWQCCYNPHLVRQTNWRWNNSNGHSVNWGSRESKDKEDRPKALAIGSGGDLTGYGGEEPRELDWSSLGGTCSLIYYYVCMYMFISDLLMNVLANSGA